jgi:nitroreductase
MVNPAFFPKIGAPWEARRAKPRFFRREFMPNLMRFALRAGAPALAVTVFIAAYAVPAQNAAPAAAGQQPISLPAPQTTGGMPLMQALQNRHTTRAFRDQALPTQTLSNLLWAAFGVNRATMPVHKPVFPSGMSAEAIAAATAAMAKAQAGAPKTGRTAPSAMNSQDIQLYVVLAQGVYTYDGEHNQLVPVASGDQRSKTGANSEKAAVTIVYVGPAKDDQWEQVDTGFIAQNVFLFAASEGLNAWFHSIHGDQELAPIASALNIPADHTALFVQSVGYPVQ